MRILHTSDWHLGRSFHKVDLLDHQEAALVALADVVRDAGVDVVVVAGDVYDRALPPVEAVTLLDDALARFREAGAQVVLSSGNHDSARRLGFGSRLLGAAGVHVRTDPALVGEPVLLDDEHSGSRGPVAFYPLPYLEPAVAARVLGLHDTGRGPSHEAVLTAAMDAVRADLAGRGGVRSVVSAHAFVTGAAPCESERDITVGGVASVSAEAFAGVDYVALGHLHGRQQVSAAVRYSGSPLAYSFGEHLHRKGAWLVDVDAAGLAGVEEVGVPAPRPLAVLRGRLTDLLTDPALAVHEGAWCQVTLTDQARPAEAMRRVQTRFPHAVELRFEPEGAQSAPATYAQRVQGRDDLDLCCAFLDHVRHRPADDAERAELRTVLEVLRRREAEESGLVDLTSARSAAGRRRLTGSATGSGTGSATNSAAGEAVAG